VTEMFAIKARALSHKYIYFFFFIECADFKNIYISLVVFCLLTSDFNRF